MVRGNRAWGHKGVLLLVHQPQWPSSVQFVCFSLAVRPSSHATHSEPSRLTNWFGASPAHNKSHGQRKTLVRIARGVSGARTATLDAGLLVLRRHRAWLALFARARVARPPLPSQRNHLSALLGESGAEACRGRTGEQSSQEVWSM